MQPAQVTVTERIAAEVERLGSLPQAPLAMPKQRLEGAREGTVGWIGRLFGLPRLPARQPRRSGQ